MSEQPKTTHSAHSLASNLNLRPASQAPEHRTKYRYDPFGNITAKGGTIADANVYRFSSKEIHLASGMYYYLYRFYAPNLQRWINRDPLGELEDYNLYRFSLNSPVFVIDVDGRGWITFPKFITDIFKATDKAKDAAKARQDANDSAADPDASPADLDKKIKKCKATTNDALKKAADTAIDGMKLPGTPLGGPVTWPKK